MQSVAEQGEVGLGGENWDDFEFHVNSSLQLQFEAFNTSSRPHIFRGHKDQISKYYIMLVRRHTWTSVQTYAEKGVMGNWKLKSGQCDTAPYRHILPLLKYNSNTYCMWTSRNLTCIRSFTCFIIVVSFLSLISNASKCIFRITEDSNYNTVLI